MDNFTPPLNRTYGFNESNHSNSSIIGYSLNNKTLDNRLEPFLSEPHQIVALLLSIVAVLLNVLSLCALGQVQNRVSTHYRFIVSLVLSDIVIGVSVLLYILHKVTHERYFPGVGPWTARLRYRCMFIVIKCLNSTGLNSTLLNLMGMAIDHFVAILKPMHYPVIMSKQRVSTMIGGFWIIAIIAGFSDFLSGIAWVKQYSTEYNYCELVWLTTYNDEYLTFALAFVCLMFMLVIYIRICIKINCRQIPGVNRYHNRSKRNRKPLFTTLLVLGSFIVCWLPMCIFQVSLITIARLNPGALTKATLILSRADQYLFDLLLLNCVIDPIIYASRMFDVKLGYRRLFSKCSICWVGWKQRRLSQQYLFRADTQEPLANDSLLPGKEICQGNNASIKLSVNVTEKCRTGRSQNLANIPEDNSTV